MQNTHLCEARLVKKRFAQMFVSEKFNVFLRCKICNVFVALQLSETQRNPAKNKVFARILAVQRIERGGREGTGGRGPKRPRGPGGRGGGKRSKDQSRRQILTPKPILQERQNPKQSTKRTKTPGVMCADLLAPLQQMQSLRKNMQHVSTVVSGCGPSKSAMVQPRNIKIVYCMEVQCMHCFVAV